MENTNTIIIFLCCIAGIIIFGKIFIWPLKNIIKLIINSILGGFLIWIINYIGAAFSFHIGLNIITALFVRNTRNTWRNITFNNKIVYMINRMADINIDHFIIIAKF